LALHDALPIFYIGEKLGMGNGPLVDVAVDPLEGTSIVAQGTWNALSVIAIADGGHLLHAPDMYMNKIAVGPDAIGKIDINASVTENLNNIAKAKNKEVADIVVVVLDRPRHAELIKELRDAGARI